MKTLIVSSVLILSLAYTTAPAQQSIAGYWEGSISIQGQELLIKLDFKPSGDSIVATIDIPQQNARGLALKNVRYLPPKVHFELPAGPGLAVFDGQRNDGLIAGKFTQAGMEGTFAVRQGSVDQTETSEDVPEKYKPIVGTWDGAIDIMGQSLGITVSFSMKGGALKAAIDIPQQGAKGIGLNNVSFDSSRVHLELPAGPGLAVFDGTLTANSINGAFTQAGMSGSFHLSRGLEKRTEEAEEIVPYKKEEVVFFNDSIRFAGTLTLPATKG
ncbi:MAG TPA: hypothetical protein VI758_10180, partial [Bacteroidota bacterium]